MPLIDEPAINDLTGQIIKSAIEVHRQLGPGLLESVYSGCLALELRVAKLPVTTKVRLPVIYKGVTLDCKLEMDLVVNDTAVIEVKAVQAVAPVHQAQLLTYLKLTGYPVGLLINFNVPLLKNGVSRVLNKQKLRSSVPPC